MTPLNDPGLAFIAGWASCVLFIAAWELVSRLLERRETLTQGERHPCPWPVDDEAERAVRLCEFQGSHSAPVASGGQHNHVA
jgi:hypothetical protein